MRLITACLLLTLALAACDTDFDSAGGDPPTAVVITSTPTSVDRGSAQPTSTMPGAPSATEAGSGGDDPTATGTTAPAESTPTAGTQPTAAGSDSETVAEIEQIEVDVVELRALELLEDLNEEVIDRAELEARIEELIDYTPEEARQDALAYWLLRLIDDRAIDLYQLELDLLGEQVAGYYDPETKDLVVVTQTGDLTAIDKVTMAHEIVHALQDQHFDLIAIDEFGTDRDRTLALTSLVEGDATLSMGQYMLEYLDPFELIEILGESLLGPQDFEVLESAPRYIADQLVFPYEEGQQFATAIHEEGGFEGVNAAFDDPPASTEQILHPEKYLDAERDLPMEVDNPDILPALPGGWKALFGDVLGEWDLRIMLEENGVDSSQAATAAAGWGGSWYDIYESGDHSLVVLTTRWDSPGEASQFSDALGRSLESLQEDGGLLTDGQRYVWTQSSGDAVLFVSGTDRAAVEAAVAELG